jgi:hypothetical protein
MTRSLTRLAATAHTVAYTRANTRAYSRRTDRRDRGDVPGWVLITVMTAGLVSAIWLLAGPALTSMFQEALAKVTGK